MADHQFEQKVSQQLADFKLKPNAEVWQQVEEQLQEDKRRRRWFIFLPVAALLVGGLLYAVWPEEKTTNTNVAAQQNNSTNNTTASQQNTAPLTKTGSSPTLTEKTASEKEVEESNLQGETKAASQAPQKTNEEKLLVQKLKTTKKQSVAVTAQKETRKEDVVSVTDKAAVQKETAADQTIVAAETKQPEQKIDSSVVDESSVIKPDTAQTIASTPSVDTNAVTPPTSSPAIVKKKWQLGFHVSTGVSDIRGSLFPGSGYKSFSDQLYSPIGSNNGGQGGATRIVQYEYAIKPSVHFGVGLLFRKPFNKRNSFVTGLQYQYSSYSVTQRQRIDTFILANNSFSNISIKEKTVKFSMHAVDVPLEMEFKIADSKKGTLLLSAGIQNWFVISSTQTDTLSSFRYAATTERSAGYGGAANAKETKATTWQPQLYLSPSFEWKGKRISSQLGLYFDYGLRPAYKSSSKDYWWQTGIRYRMYFNR